MVKQLSVFIQNRAGKIASIVKALADNPRANERLYRLEGYLYPDTYYFYSDSSAYILNWFS